MDQALVQRQHDMEVLNEAILAAHQAQQADLVIPNPQPPTLTREPETENMVHFSLLEAPLTATELPAVVATIPDTVQEVQSEEWRQRLAPFEQDLTLYPNEKLTRAQLALFSFVMS